MFHLSRPQHTHEGDLWCWNSSKKRTTWEVVRRTDVLMKIQEDLRGSVISRRLHKFRFNSGMIKTSSSMCFPTRHSWKFRCPASGWSRSGWTSREIPQRRKYRAFIYLGIYHVFFNLWQVNERSNIINNDDPQHLTTSAELEAGRILSPSPYQPP